jgi:hypothetical protein
MLCATNACQIKARLLQTIRPLSTSNAALTDAIGPVAKSLQDESHLAQE